MSADTDAQATAEPTVEDLKALPPSAKLVYKAVDANGQLTQGEIREETLLHERTAREGIYRLEEAGLLEGRISFMDARKRIYTAVPVESDQ